VGITDGLNRATVEAGDIILTKYTIYPKLRLVEQQLNQDLVSMFDGDLFCAFDTPAIEDREQNRADWDLAMRNYSMVPNELRNKLGLPPVPWGDKPLVPFYLFPLGSEPVEITESAKPAEIKQKRVRKLLTPDDIKKLDELLDKDDETELLTTTGQRHLKRGLKKGFLEEASRMGISGASFNLSNPEVVRWLKKKGFDYWVGSAYETGIKMLKKTLSEGIAAGESIKELSDRVNQVYDFAERYRADRIARTESGSAYNGGGQVLRDDEGIEKKTWISTLDDKTRDWHREVDGQIVKNDEAFSVGGEDLQYPCDPAGSSKNVCNCRCDSTGYIERSKQAKQAVYIQIKKSKRELLRDFILELRKYFRGQRRRVLQKLSELGD
jgi:SPP1 gp7 family putative phage head morphogenesis protein